MRLYDKYEWFVHYSRLFKISWHRQVWLSLNHFGYSYAIQTCEIRWPWIVAVGQELCSLPRCCGEESYNNSRDTCWYLIFGFHSRLAKAKSHPIFSDIGLNTDDVVYLNIYQNFLLCAYKMHSYLRDWGLSAKKNAAFIRGTMSNQLLLGPDWRSHRYCTENDPSFLFNYTEQGRLEKTDDKSVQLYTQSGRSLVRDLTSV